MTAKNQTLVLFIFVFFTSFTALAEVLHWSQACKNGELVVQNHKARSTSVWLQSFDKELLDEAEYSVAGYSKVFIPITESTFHSLLHFNDSGSLSVNYHCEDKVYRANTLEGGVLTFKKTPAIQNFLWIQNLYSGTNEFEIELLLKDQSVVSQFKVTLSSFENHLFKTPDSDFNWSFIRVKASHKYSSFSLNKKGSEDAFHILPQQSAVDLNAAYFLVGPQAGKDDSFIVKIQDPAMIARARDLIQNPQKEKMLFARIQKDHQGFNRNWNKPEKNYWSWSVTEVTNFDDFGSITCNGTPQELEDRVDFKVNNVGRICFWDYRVKKELSPSEVSTGVNLNP